MNKKARILIVDDVTNNIQVLGQMLKEFRYNINIANNGVQALEVLSKTMPDLILLDVMMPEMDGYETIKHIRSNEKYRDIPVIFLTAKSEPEDVAKGFELGAVDYVTKPFNAIELMARVKNHLELKEAREIKSKIRQIEMYRAMVVTANHNIAQPLNVISGNLELIQIYNEDKLDSRTKQCIKNALDASETIKELLHKLEEIEKPELIDYAMNEKMLDIK
ncbi:MAG: response regulator [Candidatus Delongbacteria bacterium]|nr:response regulator [Candidatus Delongbacteria bacterium]MBN2837114.1 response regulator [Candidatus Delongbacteria bacterium]